MSQHIGHLPGVSGNIPVYQVASERKKKSNNNFVWDAHAAASQRVRHGCGDQNGTPMLPKLILTLYIMMKIDNLRRKWKMTSKMQLTKQNSFYFV